MLARDWRDARAGSLDNYNLRFGGGLLTVVSLQQLPSCIQNNAVQPRLGLPTAHCAGGSLRWRDKEKN